jgi:hypothetical protein
MGGGNSSSLPAGTLRESLSTPVEECAGETNNTIMVRNIEVQYNMPLHGSVFELFLLFTSG